MAVERIELTVPGRAEYARAVRIIAATLASRSGMSIDEVDDVRMALEEAFLLACARIGADGPVTFRFDVDDDRIDVCVGPLPASGDGDRDEEAGQRYSRFILEAVCDTFQLDTDGPTCFVRLTKLAGAVS